MSWPGATGLAEDVRRYGKWMRDEAEKRIGHLYPKVKVSGVDCTVIAWIWARTVTCPNPACAGTMPLVRSFWLGKKKGKERYVVPIPDGKRVRFEIGGPDGVPRDGTVGRTGAVCLLCGTPVPLDLHPRRRQGRSHGRPTHGDRRRRHAPALLPRSQRGARESRRRSSPRRRPGSRDFRTSPRYLTAPNYGMRTWADLFTNRQLTALTTFSDLVQRSPQRAHRPTAARHRIR